MNALTQRHTPRRDPRSDRDPAVTESAAPSSTDDPQATSHESVDFRCSAAQERFWLLDRLEPGNPAYNVAVRWRLEGTISPLLLEQAWERILQRHEILRTVFIEEDSKPIQRVLPPHPFRLTEIDLTPLAESERQAEADRIGLIEARAPFDLSSGPLIRVTLLRLGAAEAIMLVTSHQVVCDGWSIGVMAREMGLIYQALTTAEPVPLPELPLQYGDYAAWRLEWLRARGTDKEQAYWSRQLAGVQPFEVPPDLPRPVMPTTHGAIASLVLPRHLTDRAQRLSNDHGATLFATALATLCATLSRYSGRTEVVLGTQVSDRDQVELETMIGQFVNSLVLRVPLADDPSFGALIERVRDTTTDALEHRHIPIERLLDMVKAERHGTASAPISINFIFQKSFVDTTSYGPLRLIDLPSLPSGAIYDLNFFMVERPDGWRFSCQYNTDQFEAGTAERLLHYCRSVLESAVATPHRRISELPIDDHGEGERLIGELNSAHHDADAPHTLQEWLLTRLARSPEAVAVDVHDRAWTFHKLDVASERLASALARSGVAPPGRVAVVAETPIERLVALCAIFRAGACYLSLHPADSPEFLSAELRAADAAALLIGTSGAAALGDLGIPVIEISPQASAATQRDAAASPTADARAAGPPAAPKQPALVRGTKHEDGSWAFHEISQGTLAQMMGATGKRAGIGEHQVSMVIPAAARDTGSLALLLPLLHGSRMVVGRTLQIAPPDVGRQLERHDSLTLLASTAVLSELARTGWKSRGQVTFLCDGPVGRTLATELLARGQLWVLRGWDTPAPWSSMERIVDPAITQRVRPLPGSSFRLLSGAHTAPPLGAAGELYVVTASDSAGAQPHPTRELARVRADGALELLSPAEDSKPPVAPGSAALPGTEASARPATDLERQLERLWASLLGQPEVDCTANFFEIGGHSLLAARMLARVHVLFGRQITLATLFRGPTIRNLAKALQSDHRELDFRQVVRLQANGSRLPLLAINNTGSYYLLARQLGPDQPFTSLQLFDPSLKTTQLPASLEEMATRYVELIRRVQPRGPYVLLGWCAAGALAFEIACQLIASGQTVLQLFLLDSWVPRYFERLPGLRRWIAEYSLRWQFLIDDWRTMKARGLGLKWFLRRRSTLALLTDAQTAAQSLDNDDVLASHDQWLLRYLQGQTRKYEPKIYPGKVTLIRSRGEPTGWWFDKKAGWSPFAAGGVELHMVEGNHFTMFHTPGVQQIAACVSARLDKLGPARDQHEPASATGLGAA